MNKVISIFSFFVLFLFFYISNSANAENYNGNYEYTKIKAVTTYEYIVKENDTIDKIAQKYGLNPTLILINNSITPHMIKKGNILFIKDCF